MVAPTDKRLTPAELSQASDEELAAIYRAHMRPDLTDDENAYFVEVITERNDRTRRAAWGEWAGQSLSIARAVARRP